MNRMNLSGRTRLMLRKTWPTQLATFLAVTLAIVVFSFFCLVAWGVQQATAHLSRETRFVVILNAAPLPAFLEQIQEKIRVFDTPREILYVPPRAAVARFARQLGDDHRLLEGLPPDFLPPAIEIIPGKNSSDPVAMRRQADYLASIPGVVSVRYGEKWLTRLQLLSRLSAFTVLTSGLLVLLITTSTVATTIRLAVQTRRDEIRILRLLGAPNSYIRSPFLLASLGQGLAGSLVGLLTLFVLWSVTAKKFAAIDLAGPAAAGTDIRLAAVAILCATTLLCFGACHWSLRRHLTD